VTSNRRNSWIGWCRSTTLLLTEPSADVILNRPSYSPELLPWKPFRFDPTGHPEAIRKDSKFSVPFVCETGYSPVLMIDRRTVGDRLSYSVVAEME
jgi:hypothetical protein